MNQLENKSTSWADEQDDPESDLYLSFSSGTKHDEKGNLVILSTNTADKQKSPCYIFDSSDKSLVMGNFPITPEYTSLDQCPITDEVLNQCEIHTACEGCVIRVFFHEGQWHLATNRKLDAFECRWFSATSFGENFVKALGYPLEDFLSKLNPGLLYFFLLGNNDDTRIVCKSNPKIYLLQTLNAFSHRPVSYKFSSDSNIHIVEKLNIGELGKTKWSDLCTYVNEMDHEKVQGIIVTKSGVSFKLLNRQYSYLFGLRNNSSIKFRYLEIRTNPDFRSDFRQLYHLSSDTFDRYEKEIQKLIKYLFYCYTERYVNRKFTEIEQDEHVMISKLAIIKKNKPITLEDMEDYVNHLNASILNKVIKRNLWSEKKDKKEN